MRMVMQKRLKQIIRNSREEPFQTIPPTDNGKRKEWLQVFTTAVNECLPHLTVSKRAKKEREETTDVDTGCIFLYLVVYSIYYSYCMATADCYCSSLLLTCRLSLH